MRSVVTYVLQHGFTPEELVSRFPELTLAQVHDALAYFYDNREEIQNDINPTRVKSCNHASAARGSQPLL